MANKREQAIEEINALGRLLPRGNKPELKEYKELFPIGTIFLKADELLRNFKDIEMDVKLPLEGEKSYDYRAVLGDFFCKDLILFDPDKYDLYPYMLTCLKRRAIDRYHKDAGDHTQSVYVDEFGEPLEPGVTPNSKVHKRKKTWVSVASADQSVNIGGNADDDETLMDRKVDENASASELADLDDTAVTLLTLMLNVRENLSGKAKNESRIRYFQMFFTDGVVNACHTNQASYSFARHERDLFDAMRLGFLDFFMKKVCRTVPEICTCNVKLFGEMIEGKPMKEPGFPLPNDVYVAYLGEIENVHVSGDSAVSEQRKAYKKYLEQTLFG